jgi:DinB superfamily
MDRCDECGFVFAEVPVDTIPAMLRALASRYRERLVGGSVSVDRLRRHEQEGVWSPLEYACHVRDVLEVQCDRILLALEVDEPEIVPMGREERVLDLRYNEQDPADVADAIDRHADALALTVAALTPEQWQRTVIYQWPTRAVRTLEWVARNVVHEGEHHLLDMVGALGSG